MKPLLVRLLREPLVHFLAIGALMFAVFAAMNEASEPPPDVIVITPERIDQIAAGFESVWRRKPAEDELDALIEEDVREEVYYREAMALGLDRNDALVRRRLRLKMEFLMDNAANAVDPVAGELEAYFAANEELYQLEPRLAFEQIYLGESPSPEIIARSLSVLQSDPATDPFTLGERTLLPAQLGLSPADVVFGVFGRGFFERLAELPPRVWAGPVASTYGVHLVRILDGLPARAPRLEEVRKDVLRDWKTAKQGEIRDRDYAARRTRFTVEIRRRDTKTAMVP
ncbi:MAG: peptidylprolyl isomerase [Gammaproteobacteria bacterium]|nr:MAG: peptidylprolyl isomerase [Gammaproteobacteria bacterium]